MLRVPDFGGAGIISTGFGSGASYREMLAMVRPISLRTEGVELERPRPAVALTRAVADLVRRSTTSAADLTSTGWAGPWTNLNCSESGR